MAPLVDDPKAESWPSDAEGVDRSLVRWMLSLTPTERLETVESEITMLDERDRRRSLPRP